MVPLRVVAESLNLFTSWNERTRAVMITTPPPLRTKITGSPQFIEETERALGLLQDSYPAGYNLVAQTFTEITEADIAADEPIAWTKRGNPTTCFFNSRLGSLPTYERAVYLCHEATHAALENTLICSAITDDDNEAIAYIVTYRAAVNLGAHNLARGAVSEALRRLRY
jgi:hypothetical protein